MDATGRENITFRLNLRDIDGSADNAVQPVAVQYRTSETGAWINVPGGYRRRRHHRPQPATLVTAARRHPARPTPTTRRRSRSGS